MSQHCAYLKFVIRKATRGVVANRVVSYETFGSADFVGTSPIRSGHMKFVKRDKECFLNI
uniref:Uncharacterized protein n=1 Tax=Rhizophagus irregularis (strain DAOM 181602 / DAOM 197198 / MUCL 43194) TaxID=747089 RepID=U9UCD5_RHIID